MYLDLWRNPSGFDPGKGTLKTYLAVMTRSRALDTYRRLIRHDAAALDESIPAPETDLQDRLIARELSGALRDAVDALAEPDREIVLRRYFFEEKPAEIAARLARPVKEIHNRLYASKQKLRNALFNKEDL